MPRFPIVDCHVHFYDPGRLTYPWLDDVPSINGTYLPAAYDAALGVVKVERIVFVEVDVAPGQEVAEARFVEDLAASDTRLQGIVASAPVEDGQALSATLDALAALPHLRGIRRLIQHHPEPDYCLSPSFIAGVRAVGKRGLSFDICIRHHQLASAVELVERCPEVSFVLDHIAKPGIAAGLREPWMADLKRMAARPNVVCKLSGVATEADPGRWTRDDLQPYIEHAMECFGLDRLLFASDWPVMNLATTFQAWVALLDDVLAGHGEAERMAFYRDNAIRTYRLA